MSARKSLTLREKIKEFTHETKTDSVSDDDFVLRNILRLIRGEQRRKCRECEKKWLENWDGKK
jgi:hypothetical protein